MSRFQSWVLIHPVLLALATTFFLMLVMILSFSLGMAFPNDRGANIGQTIGRLIGTACFICLLWRLGWLQSAGMTRCGEWGRWLMVLIPMIWVMITAVLAYTGDLRYTFHDPVLAATLGLNMLSIGLVEETAFRGLIFHGLLRAWSGKARGVAMSVVVSALFFGGTHMIWAAMGKPIHLAGIQSFSAFLAGIYYAAFVYYTGSIWPVVLFHGAVNAAVNLKVLGMTDFAETTSAGLIHILLILPVVGLGIILLRRSRDLGSGTNAGQATAIGAS